MRLRPRPAPSVEQLYRRGRLDLLCFCRRIAPSASGRPSPLRRRQALPLGWNSARRCRRVESPVGPHVSIGADTKIADSTIENSIIQSNSTIENTTLKEAMIGNHVRYKGTFTHVSIGDYSVLE